jgi:hypothetical protein
MPKRGTTGTIAAVLKIRFNSVNNASRCGSAYCRVSGSSPLQDDMSSIEARIPQRAPNKFRGASPAGKRLHAERETLPVKNACRTGPSWPIRAHTEHHCFLGSAMFFGSAVFVGSSAFLVSAGLASSFLGVAAGPLALRISWMYCSKIRAR